MPVYRVIYDVREVSDVSTELLVQVLVAEGLGLWMVGRADAWLWSRGALAGRDADAAPASASRLRNVGLTFAMFALLLGGSMYWMEYSGKKRLRDALESGDFTVVEGHVQAFQRGDRGGHQEERFTVVSDGRRYTYEYKSSNLEPGFHESHGPIREGFFVRIADVDGQIARLEIAN
ncbi:hypothetical protein [Actinosynnema sp.]|uniref:hypothetical protein n=1 Tax=Actinosynnema sp. TaxID=1872144 RepID=UPI003F8397FF